MHKGSVDAGSTWPGGGRPSPATRTVRRRRCRCRGLVRAVVAILLPLVLNVGRNYLFAQVCIFAIIALSLTVLTGWAGQLSLGQFGLVPSVPYGGHLGTRCRFRSCCSLPER